MLAIDCQICKDALGGDKLPVTMPCGHMYCLDCATFWFNSGDNKKCFCGKVFTGDQIIRLWTSNDDLGADAHLGYTHDREELMDVCETSLTGEAIMDPSGKDSAVVSALQRVQNFVEASTRGSDEAGIKNLLKDVRYVLSGIKSSLERNIIAQPPVRSPWGEIEKKIRELNTTVNRAQELLAQEQASYEATLAIYQREINELRESTAAVEYSLRDYQRKARELRDKNRDLEMKNDELQAKVTASVKSALISRKKYYALKQSIAQKEKPAEIAADDSSLVVLD